MNTGARSGQDADEAAAATARRCVSPTGLVKVGEYPAG